jgi:hypothetical protein
VGKCCGSITSVGSPCYAVAEIGNDSQQSLCWKAYCVACYLPQFELFIEFIYPLCNYTVNSSEYTASSDRVIGE